ncbi:MAG: hypothetical protein WBW84_18560 [Acidobacteriaceae bacterium]
MKSDKKVAHLILLSTLTLIWAAPMQAQQRWNTANTRQSYTPPPAPRPVMRSEPQREEQRYQPETRQEYTPRYVQPDNRQYNNSTVTRPSNVTRPQSVHIAPEYFAGHFGRGHGFHFNGWGPGCPTCGFTLVNGEYYFSWNGANFGVMTPIPGTWGLATDDLYVDIGDDGNYYLYDTQFPDVAVQLTFVQNPGDDQAAEN